VQFVTALLYILLALTSLFLICLVLIQRGKGGGLAGAFGASGGSSPFGSKAGDVFTRVTMISAAIWIALNMLLVVISNNRTSAWGTTGKTAAAKGSDFTPSNKVDLDKAGTPGAKVDLAPGAAPATGIGTTPPIPVPAAKGTTATPAAAPIPAPAKDAPKP